ncbi:Hypothetical protein SSA_0666 [Streptococcus sanguinis SK36]|uniref:Uncharacterized protein n=1 Tax=Streptococcus sanguinis (strain SK36) TaxID=388919 RepID=A3CLP9_STRSV|nr:Hypothetical protein SSA_0666 [Streptococcus sanguinis SK36]
MFYHSYKEEFSKRSEEGIYYLKGISFKDYHSFSVQ